MTLATDIGPLTWVKDEIDLALGRTGEALVRLAADPGDEAALKAARNHLHQAHGALSIVGLGGITQFSATLERLLAAVAAGGVAFGAGPAAAAGQALEAMRHYLDDLIAGHPDQALRLFPAYRTLVQALGEAAPAPAELFFPDLTLRPPRREHEPPPLSADARGTRLRAARLGFQRGLLKWLKNDARGAVEMRNSLAVIEATQATPAARCFWWVALAFLDAVVAGAIVVDAATRRLGRHIDTQVGKLVDGEEIVAERTLRELLYWIANAAPAGERVENVRSTFRLTDLLPDAAAPASAERRAATKEARERLAAAIEEWGRHCAGSDPALAAFATHIDALRTAVTRLERDALNRTVAALAAFAADLPTGAASRDGTVALEVATALLFVDYALDNPGAADAEFAHQADVVGGRLAALSRGEALAAREIPHLDALVRTAQERLLLKQVAKEIHASLAVVEQALDTFFRDPTRRDDLPALAKPMRQIGGALRMLGQDRAAAVLDEADALVATFARDGYVAVLADFERTAQLISALGFFVDKLQSGSADIDALLGRPSPDGAGATDALVPATEAAPASAPATPAAPSSADIDIAAAAKTVLADAAAPGADGEMRAIFVEEAREVLATLAALQPRLANRTDDRDALSEMRRAFHTLKGSGRMVGLTDLGEAAWGAEQAMNRWLQTQSPATTGLLEMTAAAHALFDTWVARIDAGNLDSPDATRLAELCERLTTPATDDAAAETSAPQPPAPPTEAPATEAMPPTAATPPADATAAAEPASATPPLKLIHSAPADPPEPLRPPQGIAVGELVLAPALFEIYCNEARGHVATLQNTLGAPTVPQAETVRAAHTLGSISASAGFAAVQGLARALERALDRLVAADAVADETWRMTLARVAGALEGMVGAIAERRMPPAEAGLEGELDAMAPPAPADTISTAPEPAADEATERSDNERRSARLDDELDPQLLPVFLEESHDLMPEIGTILRAWRAIPSDTGCSDRLKRLLHTFKGSARMAGAMGIGELAHGMESRIEQAVAVRAVTADFLDALDSSWDRATQLVDALRQVRPVAADESPAAAHSDLDALFAPSAQAAEAATEPSDEAEDAPTRAMLRIRAETVDRLVNEAGEMAIARGRIEGEMRGLKSSLLDLTENVIRLRGQLREIEFQADTQIPSRQAAPEHRFDPLELDRYTRFQELTRMMAESVNDVATVQHHLLKNLDQAGAALSAQARLNRRLSQSLMGVRMVPFSSVADRLHRIVRQTAKELDRRANLDIRGGRTEIDRSVLERMSAPLEHLLRNAVAHGIEPPAARVAAGKRETGQIVLTLAQEGNEIVLVLADDGGGIDLARVRTRAQARGLLAGADLDDERALTRLIFAPGFSTADTVSAVAGRGVGMDVVREETTALGGRIEVDSRAGRGAIFRIWLPLTLAVTQAVLVDAGGRVFAIPSTMVEQANEMKPAAAAELRAAGAAKWLGNRYPWHYLPRLLGDTLAEPLPARRHWMLLLKGGAQRLALEVDGVLGNQEIVVKPLGPQLARIAGYAGATVLGDGEVALILNPVALACRGQPASAGLTTTQLRQPRAAVPTILVVDDSLTVRKITGRLLAREGYQVMTAKDGVDALDQMTDLLPDVLLADIEMPNMDGFELIRHVRADRRLKHLPVVVVTSRTADKHRQHAQELGVDHYLGKPYDEAELLRIVAACLNGWTAPAAAGTVALPT